MKAMLAAQLGVPCKLKVNQTKCNSKNLEELLKGCDKLFIAKGVCLRAEPSGGNIYTSNENGARLWIDREVLDKLWKGYVNINELDNSTLYVLIKKSVLTKNENYSFRKFAVDIDDLPTRASLEITSKCNCSCVTCYNKKDISEFTPSYADIVKTIKKLHSLGMMSIALTGGEPFLNEDLERIIDVVLGLNMSYYINTNGSLLSDANDSLINKLKEGTLAISLDGIGKTHDCMRSNKGLFEKIEKGVAKVRQEGIDVCFVSTLSEYNIDEVPGLVEFAKKNTSKIQLRAAKITGAALDNNLKNKDLHKRIMPYLNDSQIKNGFLASFESMQEARYYGCKASVRISLDTQDVLVPCLMDRSLKKKSIHEYTRESLVKELTDYIKQRLSLHKTCKSCVYNKERLTCMGYCHFSNAYLKGLEK